MSPGLWPCARFGRSHGLHGEVYLELLPHGDEYLELGERFSVSKEGADEPTPVRLERRGGTSQRPLVRVEGVTSKQQAAAFAGSLLLAAGDALDRIPHYVAGDLIGLRAVTEGRELGEVVDVLQGQASDLLELRAPGGESILVPLVDELVQVRQAEGVVVIREGLL